VSILISGRGFGFSSVQGSLFCEGREPGFRFVKFCSGIIVYKMRSVSIHFRDYFAAQGLCRSEYSEL
jgi:hypothetical protein